MHARAILPVAGLLALAPPAAADTQPVSSVAGTILFTRQQSRSDDLYYLRLPDTREERVTNHAAKDSHGAVSPDGRRIVFNSERNGWWKIWLMNADGSDVQQLTHPTSGADYRPAWSPDGTRIAFVSGGVGNGDIMTMAPDGSGIANVTRSAAQDNFPAWAPDGTTIAFASDRSGRWAIHVAGVDGTGLRQLTNDGDALEPDWFPDGDVVAFQSNAGDEDGHFHLWSLDIKTGAATQLTDGPHDDARPAVSPDGKWIAFESDRAGGRQLFLIAAGGGEVRQLTTKGYCYAPNWVPVSD